METPFGEIYVATCSLNGKRYVGQTTNGTTNRWDGHLKDAKYGRGHLLARAIRKYGIENFAVEVVDTASTQEELDEKEIDLIAKLRTQAPNGYNLASGGSRGKHSLESKAKMAESRRGKKLTPEHRKHIGQAGIGRVTTSETKAKISAANTGRTKSPEARLKMRLAKLGKRHSPEHVEKNRQAQKGRKPSPQTIEAARRACTGRKMPHASIEKTRQANLGRKPSEKQLAHLRRQNELRRLKAERRRSEAGV